MTSIEFSSPTRVVRGRDAVDRTGELARELEAERIFLVTDPGLCAAGHAERVEASLLQSALEVRRFDSVRENPTTKDVDACRTALGDWDVQLLVGLGGGSSIDVAKGCAFLHAGGGRMEDYRGPSTAKGILLPLIAIPTTAGTGSEVQSYALIGQEETHQKMACGDPQATPRIAILDPTLSVTQPPYVTARTGLDALGHAVETAVTKNRNDISAPLSLRAFQLVQTNLPRVLLDPNDLEARENMLLGAACAGLAIENSMLGAAHSMANPLTAHYQVAHGQAVGMMLPHVVRYNAVEPAVAALYAVLARTAQLAAKEASDAEAVLALLARLDTLLEATGLERTLGALSIPASAVPALAEEASRQSTARFNPREVTVEDFVELFRQAGPGLS